MQSRWLTLLDDLIALMESDDPVLCTHYDILCEEVRGLESKCWAMTKERDALLSAIDSIATQMGIDHTFRARMSFDDLVGAMKTLAGGTGGVPAMGANPPTTTVDTERPEVNDRSAVKRATDVDLKEFLDGMKEVADRVAGDSQDDSARVHLDVWTKGDGPFIKSALANIGKEDDNDE